MNTNEIQQMSDAPTLILMLIIFTLIFLSLICEDTKKLK